jgi:hypothetical protein
MQLSELYNIAITNNNQILTEEQKNALFLQSCITFFSQVKIKFELDLSLLSYDEAVANKKNEVGDFEVVMKTEKSPIDNTLYIFVEPTDYNNFDLPTNYSSDFIKVCSFFILQTSIKNNMFLRNAGIQGVELPQQDLSQIETYLSNRYSIGISSTVRNDR